MLDSGGIVAVRGAADFPSARRRACDPTNSRAGDFVAEIQRFLLAEGKSACVSARIGADDDITAALVELGFQEYGQTPEMVCEARLADQHPGDGVTVRLAANADDVRAYAEIAGERVHDTSECPKRSPRRRSTTPK